MKLNYMLRYIIRTRIVLNHVCNQIKGYLGLLKLQRVNNIQPQVLEILNTKRQKFYGKHPLKIIENVLIRHCLITIYRIPSGKMIV